MSDPTQDLTGEQTRAQINRAIAETYKLQAETNKLVWEATKFTAEAAKLNRDRFIAPFAVVSGAVGGGIATAVPFLIRWLQGQH